jgi:hypothetical protein
MGRALVIVLAILIVATVGIYAKYAHDLTAARARLVDRSKTMVTSFGTMEYAVVGQGEPMLIAHGAEGGFDQSIDMTGELAQHGYQLIAPSRFGYLRSTLPADLTTAMQANAMPNSSTILAKIRWSSWVSLPVLGRPCSSPSVIRTAAKRWYFSFPPTTCRLKPPSMAALSPGRFSTLISSPGSP